MNIPNIAKQIEERLDGAGEPYPVRSNWASEVGFGCARRLAYLRQNGHVRERPSANLQMIFKDGKLHERMVDELIRDLGYEIIENQTRFEYPEFDISGKIEGKILIDGLPGTVRKQAVPYETKSLNPHDYARLYPLNDLDAFAYMRESDKFWMRKWPAQILTYCLCSSKQYCIFFIKAKAATKYFPLKQILVDLFLPENMEFAEAMLRRVQITNAALKDKSLPDPIDYDEVWCDNCEFKTVCLPGKFNQPPEIVQNERLIELCTRRKELEGFPTEYKKVTDEIKKITEQIGKETVLVGDYVIECGLRKTTVYDYPDEVKAEYRRVKEGWSVKKVELVK